MDHKVMGRRSQGKSVWSGKHGSSWSIFSPAVGWEAVVGSIHSLSHVQLFLTPWTAAHQAFFSTTNSQRLLKLKSIKLVMPSNHLFLCRPLLLLWFSEVK